MHKDPKISILFPLQCLLVAMTVYAMRTPPSMQPVISEYHFILTESSGSKKMADSLSCTGNVQDESQLTCDRQQGAIKNNELVPKGHRSQTKRPLTALG